ncbi:ISAzo13 family transposase [Virgibacillus sp. 179-BFC.A HS]|uniref:ISAzo13 family transposase n=1 Tax=Tigheibacillus jepli TaxID=3035914 RepID=A0ABU5CIX8_9BACI|nr:ISAzo13 family transposase [Virgibacillus sp. 179-BFC.A HS]MDY0406309.1 ISAzo13 family transposase [Virgibacillus sp. 179-BFC.A HS]
MIQDFFTKFKDILHDTINKLTGSDKRIALAKTAKAYGKGGQSLVAEEFNVSRDTIRKGLYEMETGICYEDAFYLRGRKKAEEKLPDLLKDIKEIVDGQSQTDPNFKTTRLFTRLTIEKIREQLIEKGYTDEELPSNQTLNTKTNQLGYKLDKVKKTKPAKKIKETDVIFENLKNVNDEYHDKDNVLRLSIDTKDRVKIGPFSRGGKSRTNTQAVDHDFGNEFMTPFGILDLSNDHLELVFTKSKVTADFMVDAIETYWLQQKSQNPELDTLIINADNGPENNSRRTQFMKRIIELSAKYDVKVIMAYYPPYHSKYNPVERAWGVLEQHWNGDILDSEKAILGFAKSMTWKGKHPRVTLVEEIYETGKKVGKKVMEEYEKMIDRLKGIEKWFVEIHPQKCKGALEMAMKV